jgi:hypothetical protein
VEANALTEFIDLEGDIKRLLGPFIRLYPIIELSHQSVKDHFLNANADLERGACKYSSHLSTILQLTRPPLQFESR